MSQIPAVHYFVSSSSLVGRYFRLAGVHDALRSSLSHIVGSVYLTELGSIL